MKTKVLYIAKYAPKFDNEYVNKKPKDILYAEYHQDIYKALKRNFNIFSSTNPEELIRHHNSYDYVFTLLNKMNFNNSEIFIAALCEYYKIPYLGATPNIRAIAEDKHLAKLQAKYLNIKTAPWITVNHFETIFNLPFDGPYFIKPRYGATSINIDDTCICRNNAEVQFKLKYFQNHKIDVIIEKFIDGKTYTNGVISNFNDAKIFPVILEHGKSNYGITTYNEKRRIEGGLSRTIVYDDIAVKIKEYTKKYYESLQPIDYARFDYIVEHETNKIYFIEFNICCNLGKVSAMSIGAAELGLSYEQLIDNIVYSSMKRQNLSIQSQIHKF